MAGKYLLLLRGFFLVGLVKIASIPLAMGLSIAFARSMDPEGYGAYAFYWTLIIISAAVTSGGISHLVTREVSNHFISSELFQKNLVHKSKLLAAAVFLMCFIAASLVRKLIDGDDNDYQYIIFTVAACALSISIININGAALRAFGKSFLGQAILLILAPLLAGGAFLLHFRYDESVISSLTAMLVGYCLSAIISELCLIGNSRKYITTGFWSIGDVAKKSISFSVFSSLGIISLQINVILAGIFIGSDQVSYYFIAEKLAQFAGLPVGILELVFAPTLIKHAASKVDAELKKVSRIFLITGLIFATAITVPLLIYGGDIVSILYGEQYRDTVEKILWLLLIAHLIKAATGPASIILLMTGNEKYCIISQAVSVLTLIACVLFLSEDFGIYASALGFVVSSILSHLIIIWGLWRAMKLNPLFL